VTPEQSLLGSILVGGRQLFRAASASLDAKDFEQAQHAVIWDQMARMDAADVGIDIVTVTSSLEARNKLDAAGGYLYVTSLIDEIPDVDNLSSYCKLIVDARTKRELSSALNKASSSLDAGTHPIKVVGELQKAVRQTLKRDASPHVWEITSLVEQGDADIRAAIRNHGRIPGIPTGFRDLDSLTGGLQQGDLFVVGARPSVGKSALATCIAYQVALRAKSVVFFSLEMAARQVESRLRAIDSGVDLQRLRFGNLGPKELEMLDDSGKRLASLKIVVDDTPSISVAEVAARAQKVSLGSGLDLMVIDYLQLMGKGGGSTRAEQIASNAYSLKALAKELSCTVMALSQISRQMEREDREPVLSDLKESGGIEEAADVALLLHVNGDPNIAALTRDGILAKQRNGPTGRVGFAWHGPTASFREPIQIVGGDASQTPSGSGMGRSASF
jgi:replicative DNA helicase